MTDCQLISECMDIKFCYNFGLNTFLYNLSIYVIIILQSHLLRNQFCSYALFLKTV